MSYKLIEPTIITWILIIFGVITFLPLLYAQILALLKPKSKKTKDILIGKGEDWRDKTHFKSASALAWADSIVLFPVIIAGSIGVALSQTWGYVLWIASGFIAIYFSIICWVMEREYTYPSYGPLAYYTYYWGFFLYWGVAVIIYSIYRLFELMIL